MLEVKKNLVGNFSPSSSILHCNLTLGSTNPIRFKTVSPPSPGNYVSVKSKLKHHPPGIPRAFDVFSCPGGREFDELSLPGGGEFDHYS